MIDGKFFNSGSSSLYLKQSGDKLPVVVIESALGGLSAEWESIQEKLSSRASVITYDRAGYGESPEGTIPRTAFQINIELLNALRSASAEPPYIFIGNSIGGFYAQTFAKNYPDMVKAILLADSMTEWDKEFEMLDAPVYQHLISMQARMDGIKNAMLLEDSQFQAMVRAMLDGVYEDFPKELAERLKNYQSNKLFYQTTLNEWEAFPESIEEYRSISDFPDIPVYVLSRDYKVMTELAKHFGVPEHESKLAEELWMENSKKLASLSSKSKFEVVEGSSHSMHLSHQDLIIKRTLELIDL